MAVLVGKKAPDFSEKAVKGSEVIENFTLSQFEGKYVVLFFYPLDFTFVCPTELHAFNEKLAEFKERNVEVVAVSTDSWFSHLAWLQTPKAKGGIEGVEYPLVSDFNKTISQDYDVDALSTAKTEVEKDNSCKALLTKWQEAKLNDKQRGQILAYALGLKLSVKPVNGQAPHVDLHIQPRPEMPALPVDFEGHWQMKINDQPVVLWPNSLNNYRYNRQAQSLEPLSRMNVLQQLPKARKLLEKSGKHTMSFALKVVRSEEGKGETPMWLDTLESPTVAFQQDVTEAENKK